MKKSALFLAVLFFGIFPWNLEHRTCSAQSKDQPVSFTLSDRDRSIRMEEKISSLEKSTTEKISSLEKSTTEKISSLEKSTIEKISSLRNEMNTRFDTLYWAFGIIVTLVLFQLGYTIWDRRTTLYPLLERTYQLSEKSEQLKREVDDLKELKRLKEVIKQYAQTDTKLAELLRKAAIL